MDWLSHLAVSKSFTPKTCWTPALATKVEARRPTGSTELARGLARSAATRSPGAFPGSCLTLEDGPELEAVARHEAHGALHGFQTAEGSELVEEEKGRAQRGLRAVRSLERPGGSLRPLRALRGAVRACHALRRPRRPGERLWSPWGP